MDAFPMMILGLFFSLFLCIIQRKWHSSSRKDLPPSPRKLPVLGNLHQVGQFAHRSLQALSRRHGPLMLLHFGRVPVLIASSSDAAREIMKNQDKIFSNRPKLSIPDRLIYGSRSVAFSPYGDYWRQARSIYMLHLLSTKRVQSFYCVKEEETSAMIERIIAQMAESSLSWNTVNLSDAIIKLTNDVACRVAFGRKYGDNAEGRKFKRFLEDFVELLGTLSIGEYIPWLGWIRKVDGTDKKVEKVAKWFDEFLEDVIQEHRCKRKRDGVLDGYTPDFVDILLEFQRENREEVHIDDGTIKALILEIFVGGTETIATALEWTLAELQRNPRVMRKLENEVRKASSHITEDDLEKMPYLKAVIMESLRLHAPVPLLVPRESIEDTQLMGYYIAKGTRVMINAWAIGRDPLLWENPEVFYPERFLDSTTDLRGLHFEFIPFGAGRRGCPGIAFTMAVVELALAKLVHNFDFSLPGGMKPMDLDMKEAVAIVAHKKHPLIVAVSAHAG